MLFVTLTPHFVIKNFENIRYMLKNIENIYYIYNMIFYNKNVSN